MSSLYTKNGVPLRVSGSRVYNPTGQNVGHISGDRVHGLDGRYRGTIVGDRLVYRSTHAASAGSAGAGSAGYARASRAASALWGRRANIGP